MERRLAAILAADAVGYSRLMEADEDATARTLGAYREMVGGLIASHHGRVFGSAGDSVIAEFASPVEAVRCAVAMGQLLAAQASETGRRFRQAWGERLIDAARYKAKDKKVGKFDGRLMEGGPARTILKLAADRKVDLIVMGRRGLGDLQGLLLGSVSHKVTSLADCPCLTVK